MVIRSEAVVADRPECRFYSVWSITQLEGRLINEQTFSFFLLFVKTVVYYSGCLVSAEL